jgi:hypothetical protein
MRCKLSLLAGITTAVMLMPASLVAAGQPPLSGPTAESAAVVQQAQFRSRCGFWRRECARRWGWRTGRWDRCLARRGC